MKFQTLNPFRRLTCLSLLVALTPVAFAATAADTVATPPAPPVATPAADATAKFSRPANEVVKLVSSGVSEDVVKSYIQISASTFNLSPDNIIALHNLGISPELTKAMLNHDQAYQAQAAAIANPSAVQPTAPPQQPVTDYTQPAEAAQPADDSAYYNQLSPYGTWTYAPGYGYGWQPYSGLAYNAYPWDVLAFGAWNFCPGFGWCWFPHSHFGYGHYYGFNHGYYHGGFSHGGFVAGGHFGGNHFAGGFGHSGFTANHSAPGFSHFGGGFSGGHMGGHVGGFGGHAGGSFGGGHSGGGFGGGHGGGGGGHR